MKQKLKKETIYYEEPTKCKYSNKIWKSRIKANIIRINKRAIYRIYNYKWKINAYLELTNNNEHVIIWLL